MDIGSLERMIAGGRDSAMLRLALARLLADQERTDEAIAHLEVALEFDAGYTAAWKELGRAHARGGDAPAAERAWRQGMAVARAHGDRQAEREMGVYLKRLQRSGAG